MVRDFLPVMSKYKKSGKCSLCEGEYINYGHNPEPLKSFRERCCDLCNLAKVIPARLQNDTNFSATSK